MSIAVHDSIGRPRMTELAVLALAGIGAGVLSAAAAMLFRVLLAFFHNLFFCGTFSLEYDVYAHAGPSPWGFFIIFVPCLGALAVSWITLKVAPGARTHGVPDVMEAIYYRDGRIPPAVAGVKLLTSAISIGSGGSIGREGPIVRIGASLGSILASFCRLSPRMSIVLPAAGAAGGIAAAFDAPMGAILFSVELLLPAVSAAALLCVSLSSATAVLLTRALAGEGVLRCGHLTLPPDPGGVFPILGVLLFTGILCGLGGALFSTGIVRCERLFRYLSSDLRIRHVCGMLPVGMELYLFYTLAGFYYVQGFGYPAMEEMLSGHSFTLAFIGLLFAGKLFATCCTLGSGGSGGVFCPSLFLGAATGFFAAHLWNLVFPGLPVPVIFAVTAGMSAMAGATSGAVLSAILMVAEMTGDFIYLPACAVAAAAALAVRRRVAGGNLYLLKLAAKGSSPIPEGLQSADIMSLHAGDFADPPRAFAEGEVFLEINENEGMDSALRIWNASRADGLKVMRSGECVGIVDSSTLARAVRKSAERMI